jgi:hypothetical protein
MTPFKQQREVARHHHPHARPAFALSWDMTPLFSRERRSFHRKSKKKSTSAIVILIITQSSLC